MVNRNLERGSGSGGQPRYSVCRHCVRQVSELVPKMPKTPLRVPVSDRTSVYQFGDAGRRNAEREVGRKGCSSGEPAATSYVRRLQRSVLFRPGGRGAKASCRIGCPPPYLE